MFNKLSISIFFLLFLSLLAYSHDVKPQTDQIQNEWIAALNTSSSLARFYSDNSGLLLSGAITKSDKISDRLKDFVTKNGQVISYVLLETFQLRENQKFVLGKYVTSSGKSFYSIIAWNKIDTWFKEFEVIYESTDAIQDSTDVAAAGRKAWEDHANEHRPDLIVKNVSAKNGTVRSTKEGTPLTKIDGEWKVSVIDDYSEILNKILSE